MPNNKLRFSLLLPICLALTFATGYSSLALQKYAAHQARGDLTAYAQGLWNTLHGNFMASTFNYSVHNYWDGHFREITAANSNIFGIHFNPILLLFLPVYAIFPAPSTLLVLQAFVLAGSSVIIFALAWRFLRSLLLASLIQLSYLLHIGLVSAALSEFHAYPLTILFSCLLIWYAERKQSPLYYLSLLLLLSVQENAALPALFFGLYLLIKGQKFRGMVTAIVGLSSLLLTTKLIIPHFSPTGSYLFEGAYGSPLGNSYLEMAANSLRHPRLLFSTFLTSANLTYLGKLLLPILPMALFAPFALLTGIFTLTPNLISSAGILKSLAMHYDAVSLPYLYYALILGSTWVLTRVARPLSRHFSLILGSIILLTISFQYQSITSRRFSPRCAWSCQMYTALDREKDAVIAAIPDSSSVSTQDYFSGHFASRPALYLFPVYYDLADYVVVSKGEEIWPLSTADHARYLTLLHNSPSHQLFRETDHYLIYQKNPE